MKIAIKTLQNKKFDLEVAEGDSISDVKSRINSELGLGAPDLQKLIYHGKILKNDQTLASAKVKDKDFVVVMIAKTKKKKPIQDSQAEQAPSIDSNVQVLSEPALNNVAVIMPDSSAISSNAQNSSVRAETIRNSAASNTDSTTNVIDQSSDQSASISAPSDLQASASTLVMGAEFEQMVANLMNLGFEHDVVVRALRASYNNPDRAAEYLFSGIPDNILQAQEAVHPQQQANNASNDSSVRQQAESLAAPQANIPASPQGAQSASQMLGGITPEEASQVLQNNPELLQAIVQQISQQQPQLMQQLGGNPQALMQLLQNPQILQDLFQAMNQQSVSQGGVSASPGAISDVNQQDVIRITEEEKQAIDRLQSLGFDRRRVIEAYISCDKNEEIAANYLFDHANDIDEDNINDGDNVNGTNNDNQNDASGGSA